MIELPETYALARQINDSLIGKKIMNVTVGAHPHKFAWYNSEPLDYHEKLFGKTITHSNPGTGYTCGGNTEIICEEMLLVISTPIKYHPQGEKLPVKHQLLIEFEDFSNMSCTVQMWGAMLLYTKDDILSESKYPKGPNPLEEGFDEEYFESMLSSVSRSISAKAFLATEQRIPGLGNGVLQDILWNAGINPKTKLEKLGDNEIDEMYKCVRSTLLDMAANGGRDTEKDLFGCPGGYKTILSSNTYGKPCPKCGSDIIREAYMGGNIYYCPECQKVKK